MEFKESEFITIPNFPKVFVYFLIKDKQVVYVGKTNEGLRRPLSHKNKEYDSIHIIEFDNQFLSVAESYYIAKYKPKYNISMKDYISINRCKGEIRRLLCDNSIALTQLRRVVFHLGFDIVETKLANECIKTLEYVKVCEFLCKQRNIDFPECLKKECDLA